ncbi:helix-turn-helix transcriptional regulator [Collinsella sp. zg1085]|uniref:winged helix-turn-helix transcriptional regulator n=1 Tax=Collinsella sp. zg1085 TaxID=2844380 RepID=UPI001C0E8CA0|nr:helix-turn-helix domain-containing protein [Collinsella sp. zg1085]QWT17480.1 helix-turn-helix transcriptional regulator [Collinsella sp. zg1085]
MSRINSNDPRVASRTSRVRAENPYQHVLSVFGGKWKMTILREMAHFGSIRFNQTCRVLKVSEKVLSKQISDLIKAGVVVRCVDSSMYPPAVSYGLTESGQELIPILDSIYYWSVRDMHRKGIPLDPDALVVHGAEPMEPEEIVADEALGDLAVSEHVPLLKDESDISL